MGFPKLMLSQCTQIFIFSKKKLFFRSTIFRRTIQFCGENAFVRTDDMKFGFDIFFYNFKLRAIFSNQKCTLLDFDCIFNTLLFGVKI